MLRQSEKQTHRGPATPADRTHSITWRNLLIALGLALLVTLIARSLWDLATDDPYITYRYARNFALGHGFIYNRGDRVLSTTAPLYALMLAIGARLGADVPTLSNALGALAFWAAAESLFLLGQRHRASWSGLIAAILCASSPLLWLTLGFETGLYIALVCWAYWAFDAQHMTLAAVLLAWATIMRNDAIVAAGVLVLAWLFQRYGLGTRLFTRLSQGRSAPLESGSKSSDLQAMASPEILWRWFLLYIVIIGTWAIWLTVQFDSPVPVTLRAKSLQARFGVSGFYPRTSFLHGLTILWRAWGAQSRLHWIALPLALWGAIVLRHSRWAWRTVIWGGLVMMAYVALRVAPYPWYYAPLAPVLALLVGLGVQDIGRRVGRIRRGAGVVAVLVLVLPLLGAQLYSLSRAADAIRGPVPSPDEIASKVLPEAKTAIYRRAGEWLASNTPSDALVGMMEVGVMGYYANRWIVDLLGLLQPEVAHALARGDILWAIPTYVPDYLALTAINPLFTYPILEDPWFQRAYEPVMRFEDERFWGSPLTIYRRTMDVPPMHGQDVSRSVTEGTILEGWAADGPQLWPAMPLRVRLTWRVSTSSALDGAQVSIDLLDPLWDVAGQRVLRYDTSRWPLGTEVEMCHLLVVADQVPTGRYSLRLRVENKDGSEQFEGEVGWLKSAPTGTIPVEATPLHIQAQFAELVAYTLSPAAIRAGQPLTLTLYWDAQAAADRDWTVFVHFLDGAGQRVAQHDGQPLEGRYPTSIWGAGEMIRDRHILSLPDTLPDGPYMLLVGLYDLSTEERLALFDGRGKPLSDRALKIDIPQ